MAIAPRQHAEDKRSFVFRLTLMKDEAMRLGFYRTARLLEIPIQEIGWELQDADTPAWQKARQQETLTP